MNIWFLLQIFAVMLNLFLIIYFGQYEIRFLVAGMFIGFIYTKNYIKNKESD